MTLKKQKKHVIRELKNERDELLGVLKAIINKFGKKEIVVSDEEIAKAKQYQMYVADEYLSLSKKYKLINPREIFDSYKGDKPNE